MNSNQQTSHQPSPNGGEPSNNRRNLLKAAATMAPFVGTLPSGAALANASSVQCALFQQAEATQGRPNPITTAEDTYYRVAAKQWTTGLPPNFDPVTVFQFTALDNSTVVRVDADGNNVVIPAPPNDQPPNNAADVYLLVLYVPKDDPLTELDLVPSSTKPATCNIPSGADFSAPPGTYCIHPIADLEGTAFGNMGMTGTCLASFMPQ